MLNRPRQSEYNARALQTIKHSHPIRSISFISSLSLFSDCSATSTNSTTTPHISPAVSPRRESIFSANLHPSISLWIYSGKSKIIFHDPPPKWCRTFFRHGPKNPPPIGVTIDAFSSEWFHTENDTQGKPRAKRCRPPSRVHRTTCEQPLLGTNCTKRRIYPLCMAKWNWFEALLPACAGTIVWFLGCGFPFGKYPTDNFEQFLQSSRFFK